MSTAEKIKKYMTPFQWFEVLAVIGFTLYFAIIDKENPLWYLIINSLAAICGIFCVVLCAAGKKSQYYWGFVNIAAYIVVAWMSRFYGEVMLNGLYYLPTQFIGMYFWKKHYSEEVQAVKCKKMSPLVTVLFLILSGVSIWLYKMLLSRLGGNCAWLDSTSTTFSLIANVLMVLRYREQWVLWIIVDVVTVIMWFIAGDWIMTTMWAVYLLNACYGLYTWTKMNKTENTANE
ncbi:MAG: nicotinamide riboside transporter PnuC [Oscillospiraceae bacterium]|nr:nicotinamide riboside transporter PnuC [Oscillospiraceae bacterium]